MTSVYLAGPDVFLPDAFEIGRRKIDLCMRHGLSGLYPLDNSVDAAAPGRLVTDLPRQRDHDERGRRHYRQSHAVSRPRCEHGTVYELGYMAGRGKLCLGYSNAPSSYADRARQFTEVVARDGRLVDAEGMTVEDFGLGDNLMIIHALDLHGCALITPRQQPADIWHDLTAFETCVRVAAERLAPMRPQAWR